MPNCGACVHVANNDGERDYFDGRDNYSESTDDFLLRQPWCCPQCLIEALPFRDLEDLEDTGTCIFNVAQQKSADVGRGFPTFKLHHDDDHERPMLNREDLDPDLNITFTTHTAKN